MIGRRRPSSGSAAAASVAAVEIRPERGWVALRLAELWQYRDLVAFLVWRDVKVRYKQSVLGAAWAVIVPFMQMVVFTIFFGRIAKLSSDGIPYPVWNFTALVPWVFFSTRVAQASASLVGSQNLIKKVYFPRLALPLATVVAGLVDFAIAFVVLLGLMWHFGIAPTAHVVWLPLLTLLAVVTALGVGLWLSAINVRYRDVRHTVPFLMQIWMFSTPIVYSAQEVPEQWRLLYGLNPMVGVVEGFRWSLLGTDTRPGPMILLSSVAAVALLVSGAYYFRRMEKSFADVV